MKKNEGAHMRTRREITTVVVIKLKVGEKNRKSASVEAEEETTNAVVMKIKENKVNSLLQEQREER